MSVSDSMYYEYYQPFISVLVAFSCNGFFDKYDFEINIKELNNLHFA